jgi:hypothetical protein
LKPKPAEMGMEAEGTMAVFFRFALIDVPFVPSYTKPQNASPERINLQHPTSQNKPPSKLNSLVQSPFCEKLATSRYSTHGGHED